MKKLIPILLVATFTFSIAACGGSSGDSSPTSGLPSCTSYTPFTTAPLSDGSYKYIAPLGNLNPTGHTFPTDHIYIYLKTANNTVIPTALYSPGNVTILFVSATEHLTESPTYTDYTINFSPCKEMWATFGHVQSLSQSIMEKIGSFADSNCTTYSTGGNTFRQCNKYTNFTVSAGETLGTVGANNQSALDFTLFDKRTGPLAFVNLSRITAGIGDFDARHVVCPVDYFTSNVADVMRQYFGSYQAWRTAEPVCGEVMQDKADTAQGKWFNTSEPNSPEDPHLALVHDNTDPSIAIFSVGTSLIPVAGRPMTFTPIAGGVVNTDFGSVRADGNIYCYDNLTDAPNNTIVLLQLVDATTLEIEAQSAANCGSGPWSFTGSSMTFER